MPWFPEFASAAEMVHRQTRIEGRSDPVRQYFTALNRGDSRALEDVWPGHVVVYDPHAGEVRGHRQLRQFVRQSQAALAQRRARVETMASWAVGDRAVVELLAHLADDAGRQIVWPVAVVAESPDDRSIVFRSYFRQQSMDGQPHVRPPILLRRSAHPGDVVGRYQAALAAGDAETLLSAFTPDGYYREPTGLDHTHRGRAELRSFFRLCFSAGGGIVQENCAVTDDSLRCAVEYNCVRWGSHDLPPQAGITIYERSADGLLAAARVYDDVDSPVE